MWTACAQLGDVFLVLTCWGAAPVKTSTGNNFPEDAREFLEIVTSTDAQFWRNFLPFSTILVIFKGSDQPFPHHRSSSILCGVAYVQSVANRERRLTYLNATIPIPVEALSVI